MTRPIGYYVHHHGEGHLQRALIIARQAPDRFVLLGTGLEGRTDGLPFIELSNDQIDVAAFDGRDNCEHRPRSLHYAPLCHEGVRQRVAQIVNWIGLARPSLMVIDVSVEIAMLARLASTPTVYVRLAGERTDLPHLEAFRGAQRVLVPFHEDLDNPIPDGDWLRQKSHYFPGLTPRPSNTLTTSRSILVVVGRGGSGCSTTKLIEAARAAPQFQWRAIGPVPPSEQAPPNLQILGWKEDPRDEISCASIVIGGAGDGLVNAVIAAGRPFICIPESRPYGEQVSKAIRLAEASAAIHLPSWPTNGMWPQILKHVSALKQQNIRRLHDESGAVKAAKFLIASAEANLDRHAAFNRS